MRRNHFAVGLLVVLLLGVGCSSTSFATAKDLAVLSERAIAITREPADYDPLLSAIGERSVVLLGESTHGTHEFYRERARISLRLLRERAFSAIALEGDAHSVARLDLYIRGEGEDENAVAALGSFERFPRWMWRNRELADFVEQLRALNAERVGESKVRIFGIDMYGAFGSLRELGMLVPPDSPFASQIEEVARCFRRFDSDLERYGRAIAAGRTASCGGATEGLYQAVTQLYTEERGRAHGSLFEVLLHARVVRNAEKLYREQGDGVSGWNLRERHMAATLSSIQEQMRRQGTSGKVIVWAHNSHVGDARATDLGRRGEWTLGQLVREIWPPEAHFLLGLTTDSGEVIAAPAWGSEGRRMRLNRSIGGSHGAVLHQVGLGAFLLFFDEELRLAKRPMRAVGIVYLPASELTSHYVASRLDRQFDAILHWDVTEAVTPLDE